MVPMCPLVDEFAKDVVADHSVWRKLRTMNSIYISLMFFSILLLLGAGCESVQVSSGPQPKPDPGSDVALYSHYAPAKLDIIPLTEFAGTDQSGRTLQINLYISLLDSFGSQIKSPGIFRFELYEYVQRSAQPKGARLFLWPDIDLTNPAKNNEYWQDFLRAYQFTLDFEPQTANQAYVLQVTCLCPHGSRLSSDILLKPSK